jgi:hypothetical protein
MPATPNRGSTAGPAEAPYTEEMREVLLRAQQGDQAALPRLRELLDDRPELWRRLGDLAGHARDGLLALASGTSLLAREAIRRYLEELRAELAGPSASRLEKLLVERIAVCWLQSYLADIEAVAKRRAGAAERAQAKKRAASCQARYLAALKQLALVGRLLRRAPTPLDLLRLPVDEASGEGVDHRPRGKTSRVAAGATT